MKVKINPEVIDLIFKEAGDELFGDGVSEAYLSEHPLVDDLLFGDSSDNIYTDYSFDNVKASIEDSSDENLYDEDSSFFDYSDIEQHNYVKYAGSYAQDVMRYSDDTIDDVFEGDPDAYWNID